jgi:Family of unknown function (DUF6644)
MSFNRFPALFPFFKWCDNTALGQQIRGTTWEFPLIETIHILALAVLLGGIFLLNLRLLGVGEKRWSPATIARALRPYTLWSLITILVTGGLLYLSEALKCYDNAAFLPKMAFLFAAIIYHFTLYRKAIRNDTDSTPMLGRFAAALSLVLWFAVGVAGRAIGFV